MLFVELLGEDMATVSQLIFSHNQKNHTKCLPDPNQVIAIAYQLINAVNGKICSSYLHSDF